MRNGGYLALAVAAALAGGTVIAEDAPSRYALPGGFEAPPLASPLDDAARQAVATVLDPPSADAAEDAVRILAGLGRGAIPHVAAGLSDAGWYARAALVSALAEMDAPEATPLLVAAAGDPSFAVREAAVTGLGKTGDARGAEALLARAAPSTETAWRVRSAAAAAVRRAVLRGVLERRAGEAALLAALSDPDEDARRAALREIAPLAAEAALPALLAIFEDPAAGALDRTAALAALRAYRSPRAELVAALRRGFLTGDDPSESDEAGRALLDIVGVEALADSEIDAAIVRHLHESERAALRGGLAKLGKAAAPWLSGKAIEIARRVAAGRGSHQDTSFDEILDTLIQVDEAAGLEVVRELLTGADAVAYDLETRRAGLRKVQYFFASRLRDELRSLYQPKSDSDLNPDFLRAIVASGGDDVGPILDAALAYPKLRATALEQLGKRPDLPAGPELLGLAREAADAKLRCAAIEALSRRDAEESARIAGGLLDDGRADVREKAITWLSASRDPADFDRLLARLHKETGENDLPQPVPGEPRRADAVPTTPSDRLAGARELRTKIVCSLVQALRTTGGERAREPLLRLVASDPEARVRERAASALRSLARPQDASALLAAESAEPDALVRREILRTVAILGESPEAVAAFERLLGDASRRSDALSLLEEAASRVAPAALDAGLLGPGWPEEDRRAALAALERAGRGPTVAQLAEIVARARTLELSGDAVRTIAARPGPEAVSVLVDLLGRVGDLDRLAEVVQAIGARGAPEAEGPLLALFETTRDRAFAARFSSDPAVELYRRCAEAVAEFGSDATGDALAAHLLDRRLAHAVARHAAAGGGALVSEGAAPVTILRTLVAAIARRDEDACARLVATRLAALGASARDLALPELFLGGVARYLQEPLAYGLPARPRPAAAAELWKLVVRVAPRWSELDRAAYLASDDWLGQRGRYREAAQSLESYVRLAQVEDAARSTEDRALEACRIRVRTAQALAAEGRLDDALAIAATLRNPDPRSGELAYRFAWCRARIGRPDAEARDALAFAAAQDDRDPRIQFWLGWVTETREGPLAAIPFYEQAVILDRRRAEERTSADGAPGAAAPYEIAAYRYWLARALHATGDADAAAFLTAAVCLDDRFARQALADPQFEGWERLRPSVEKGLAQIRLGALR